MRFNVVVGIYVRNYELRRNDSVFSIYYNLHNYATDLVRQSQTDMNRILLEAESTHIHVKGTQRIS